MSQTRRCSLVFESLEFSAVVAVPLEAAASAAERPNGSARRAHRAGQASVAFDGRSPPAAASIVGRIQGFRGAPIAREGTLDLSGTDTSQYGRRIFCFGEFEADEALRELRYRGERVALQPKPLAVLFLLLENTDRVVSRSEVLERVWPGVAVEPASVTSAVRDLRRGLTQKGSSQSFIQTRHGQGYRFVSPTPLVVRGLPHPATPATGALIERDAELRILRAALDAAEGGRGALCLISGPAGIGKTSTARALMRTAAERGAWVHAAASDLTSKGSPFSIWSQVVRSMQRRSDPALTDQEWLRPVLAPLVPSLDEQVAFATDLHALDAGPGRARLFQALVELLTHPRPGQARVLCLDDLHWSDAISLQVVYKLTHLLEESHTLIVATLREAEHADEPELLRILAAVAREPRFEKLRLQPLSEAGVAHVLRTRAGAASDSLARQVHAATAGNPFFVTEIASLLDGSEQAIAHAESHGPGDWLPMPESVRDAIDASLAPESALCKELLAVAACVGSEFSLSLLAQTSDAASADVLEALAEAERAELVRPGSVPGTLGFEHPLVRDALYARLTEADRVRLHARVALALEASGAHARGASAPELSYHFMRAAPAGHAAKALRYARLAAKHCIDVFAWVEAEQHLRNALAVLPETRPQDAAIECELLIERAAMLRAARRDADPSWKQTTDELLQRAVRLARATGRADLLAGAAVQATAQHLYSESGPFEASLHAPELDHLIRIAEEALEGLGSTPSTLRIQTLLALADLLLFGSERARAEALCFDAAEAARKLGCEHQIARTRLAVWERMGVDRLEDRRSLLQNAPAIRGDTPEALELLGRTAYAQAVDHLKLGDMDAASASMQQLRALEQRLCYRSELFDAFECMRAYAQGRFAAAEAQIRETQRLMDKLDHGTERSVLTRAALLLGLRATQAQVGRLEPATRAIAAWMNEPGLLAARAYITVDAGMHDEARELFQASHAVPIARDRNWLGIQAIRAEVSVRLQDDARSRTLYEELVPFADRVVSSGDILLCLGSVSRYLALLADALSDRDAAARHFETAIEVNRRLGSPPWVARCQLEYARSLASQSGRDERSRARTLAEQGLSTAARLGLHAWREDDRLRPPPL